MSHYLIKGGNPLKGEVSVRGAKNASFKEMIAALLADGPSQISNVPQINDTSLTGGIIEKLGATVEKSSQHSLKISPRGLKKHTIPFGAGQRSRTSFLFAPALLHRFGQINFPFPGGDKLGPRPLDRIFAGFKLMGAHLIKEEDNTFTLKAQRPLTGIHYRFSKPTHTGTEALIMTAVLAKGQTILENTALEPEIDDLILFLQKMGADIQRLPKNPSFIKIKGVKKLKGATHSVIPDRNEAVTFACAALTTKGSINIMRIRPEDLKAFTKKIKEMGALVAEGKDELEVSWEKPLKPVKIKTQPHPGFMTDWQPTFSVLLTQATGTSTLIETIFPFRFQHLSLLAQMGAKYQPFNPKIKNPETYYNFDQNSDRPEFFHGTKIYGPVSLKPQNFTVKDLRAGATLTIAALASNGESLLKQTEYIERGYEKLSQRLSALGADITFIKN